jgi:hypothetical protein
MQVEKAKRQVKVLREVLAIEEEEEAVEVVVVLVAE